jgi:hypothetical protein
MEIKTELGIGWQGTGCGRRGTLLFEILSSVLPAGRIGHQFVWCKISFYFLSQVWVFVTTTTTIPLVFLFCFVCFFLDGFFCVFRFLC